MTDDLALYTRTSLQNETALCIRNSKHNHEVFLRFFLFISYFEKISRKLLTIELTLSSKLQLFVVFL